MVSKIAHLLRISAFLIFALFLPGCASLVTYTSRYVPVEESIANRNYEQAIKLIQEQQEKNYYTQKDRLLFYLDMAISYYYAGNYEKSIQFFDRAEQTIEELYTKSVSNIAASFLLNDNVLDYAGEDYEDIYINVFKCIGYLELGLFDDAFVEIRRLNEKIETLSLKYADLVTALNQAVQTDIEFRHGDIRFHNSALARYLSYLIYRAEGEYDDARIDLESIHQLWALQPDVYDFPMPTPIKGLDVDSDVTQVNVVSFVGRGPEKYAIGFKIDTYNGYILVYPLGESATAEKIIMNIEEGYHFKFSLPEIRPRESQVQFVEVYIDGEYGGHLELLEDMSQVAISTFRVKQPIIYLKTIARTVTKGIVAQEQKATIAEKTKDPIFNSLLLASVDVAVDISENADLRCWRLLPGKCMIGEFEVSPGIHDIEVRYLNAHRQIIDSQTFYDFQVQPNGLNMVDSFSYL